MKEVSQSLWLMNESEQEVSNIFLVFTYNKCYIFVLNINNTRNCLMNKIIVSLILIRSNLIRENF